MRLELTTRDAQGKREYAEIDDADFELVRGYEWGYHQRGADPEDRDVRCCLQTDRTKSGYTTAVMVRVLLNLSDSSLGISHLDGNHLNCRRVNLYVAKRGAHCSPETLAASADAQRGRGRGYFRVGTKFRAQIRVSGQNHYLGIFAKEEDAGAAYQLAAELVREGKPLTGLKELA